MADNITIHKNTNLKHLNLEITMMKIQVLGTVMNMWQSLIC